MKTRLTKCQPLKFTVYIHFFSKLHISLRIVLQNCPEVKRYAIHFAQSGHKVSFRTTAVVLFMSLYKSKIQHIFEAYPADFHQRVQTPKDYVYRINLSVQYGLITQQFSKQIFP